ncbi:MAG: 3-isopropylmalate dehydratase small subunit [Vampirovibrionales bacterium]|nr:3-isopropylmalate dehydratase small subunit [Vampirovibrionales bacterium]
MAKFTTLTARCAPMNLNNIDTDQIIPARFLKGTSKVGLGDKLFHDWRYDASGNPRPEFALNQPQYKGAEVLVAPHNLGCGSSREHAPWAIKDFGFKAMIAISFADIFKNNSLKNQLLPIALPEPVVLKLLSDIEADATLSVSIDLPAQTVSIPNQGAFPFSIDPYRKKCLVDDLDDIGFTLSYLDTIKAFETTHEAYAIQ